MVYKFEKLDVWQISLDLNDCIYQISESLPKKEEFNLKSQMLRAVNSISLNIAEGSIGASDAEQTRYLKIALHSLIEIVGNLKICERRKYIQIEDEKVHEAYKIIETLFAKLNAFIKKLSK